MALRRSSLDPAARAKIVRFLRGMERIKFAHDVPSASDEAKAVQMAKEIVSEKM
jgi:hypothetical protein